MKKSKRGNRTIITLFFLFLLLLSALIITGLATAEKNRKMQQAKYVMSSEISKLQYAIDSRVLSTEILEMIIVNNHGAVTDFNSMAARLYVSDPAIRSLQLAPDGNVTFVYPLEGNEEAFGSLFDDPDRRAEAEYARDTGKMTLAGPYELSQGGMGLVVRNPIYIDNGRHNETFWGFSVAVLNVPEIFNKAELENLSQQGYEYQIYRIRPDSGDVQMITSNTDLNLSEALEDEIPVPNGTWYFAMQPKTGWVTWRNILLEGLIALTISMLLTLLIHEVLTINQQKRKMTELANTDSLTGVYNVRYFMLTMKSLYDRKQPFGILYLDLNKFKAVNDQYGHDVGDKLLIEVAHRIKSCLRKEDYVFRIGGDEFTAVIPERNSKEFYDTLREQITESIAKPFQFSEITLHPSVSCGASRYPDDQRNVESLIQEADRNMYAMKKQYLIAHGAPHSTRNFADYS